MNNLEKEFLLYEEALELKQLGFDEPCFGYYLCKNSALGVYLEITTNWIDLLPYDSSSCKAPIYSQAFRWFRDNFGLSGWVDESFTTNNRQGVVSVKSPKGLEYIQSPKSTMFFETYEEAELACLRKLIELVKSKQ